MTYSQLRFGDRFVVADIAQATHDRDQPFSVWVKLRDSASDTHTSDFHAVNPHAAVIRVSFSPKITVETARTISEQFPMVRSGSNCRYGQLM